MRDYGIASSTPTRALGLLVALLAAAAIVLAGATREGHLANAAVRLLGLGVLLFGVIRIAGRPFQPEWPGALLLAAAILAVPVLQLVPLPPVLWTILPGKGEIAALYDAAGMPAPWHGLGLNPEGALNAALALLPGLAMFVATLTLRARARVVVVFVALGCALAGTMLGFVQVAQGPESALRFYDTTNPDSAVGFFSNRNHQASLQLATMPMVTVLLAALFPDRRGWPSLPSLLVAAAALALLAAATVMTDSRAGIILYPLVVAACALMLVRERLPRMPGRIVLAGLGAAVVLGGLIGGGAVLSRPALMDELAADPRMAGWPTVTAEGFRQLPFGTGLGTFDDVYRSREKIEGLQSAYLNHAHNDLLEIWLEAGLPGLVLIGLFLVWYGRRSWAAWRTPGLEGTLACAGSVMIGAMVLHSLVDYPLRTGAMSALFGFACALLLPYPAPRRTVAARPGSDREALAAPTRRPALPGGSRVTPWRPGRN